MSYSLDTSGTLEDALTSIMSAINAIDSNKTALYLNGSQVNFGNIYAPTASGNSGQVLISRGSGYAPYFVNGAPAKVLTAPPAANGPSDCVTLVILDTSIYNPGSITYFDNYLYMFY